MLQQSTLQFLKSLKKNNTREWFEANRAKFEQSKADFEKFTAGVLKGFSAQDESLAHLEAKSCIFRINRDVRFSKDKSPYKTNMGMYAAKGGKKSVYAGYYFHCEPGSSMMGGGLWMPMAPELKKVRQEIDYSFEELKKILQAKAFRSVYGDLDRSPESVLSRPPKGYEADNPAIEYLKFKNIIGTARLSDDDLVSKNLVAKVVRNFAALKPLVDFLNTALDE